MLIAFNFLSSRDNEKLKTPLYFSHQDASKYVSGDLEKSILMFDPRSGLLTLAQYVQILRPYRKQAESKNVFPTKAYEIIIQQAPHANPKVFLRPHPPNEHVTSEACLYRCLNVAQGLLSIVLYWDGLTGGDTKRTNAYCVAIA